MTGFYDSFGQGARDKLKTEYNAEYIQRDIGYARRDIGEIEQFIRAAHDQLEVIKKTVFVYEVSIERRDYNKVEYFVSSAQVPQVEGGQHHKIYPHDDSKRFVGKDRKAAVEYARELSKKYGNCRIVGNFADKMPAEKTILVV